MNTTPRSRQLARDSFAMALRAYEGVGVERAGRYTVTVETHDSKLAQVAEELALASRTRTVVTDSQDGRFTVRAEF